MTKSMVSFKVTGSTEYTKEEMLEKFDPLLIDKVNMYLASITGCECCITVEEIEIDGIESLEE